MPKGKKKTLYTDKEALELILESSTSEDSEFDSDVEESINDGKDPILDRTRDIDEGDSDWEPETKRATTTPSPADSPPSSSPFVQSFSRPSGMQRRRGRARSSGRAKGSGRARTMGTLSPPPGDTSTHRWRNADEPDIQPQLPPFRPARHPGPQVRGRHAATPLDFFKIFFSDLVLAMLVDNMNAIGVQSYEHWTDFSLPDLFSFLSMVIFMGLYKAPEMQNYWSGSRLNNWSFPPTVISRNMFLLMAKCLRLCPLEEDSQNQAARGTPQYDRLGKIKPIYNYIVEACKENFQPGQHISIDERMVKSKARTSLKQYIKNKPTKWGFKLFVLADSASGYTWNSFVYEGKLSITGKGLSYDSVMALMDFDKLGTGYHLYVDNFYTSPHLFRDLADKQIGACGTIRPFLVGFPKNAGNDLSRTDPRGSIRWIREDGLLFVKWKDTREVVMCSSLHTAFTGETVSRRIRNENGWTTQNVPIPSAIKDYNKHMGGVDLSDALIQYYTVIHKTKKWYRTLFYHFLDIAIVNAFILYNNESPIKMNQRKFREALITELADSGSPSTSTRQPTTPSSRHTTPAPEETKHMPFYFTEHQTVPQGQAATAGRRLCRLCHKKTPIGCEGCGSLPLCFTSGRNCFRQWHTNEEME